MPELEQPIAEQIKWDLINAVGETDETAFGYRIKGDSWWALEYNEAGEQIAEYKLTITAEKVDENGA